MKLIFDCFKLIKGEGKSIGIYNLTLNLIVNLVKFQNNTSDKKIKNVKITVLGTKYNRKDFGIDGVDFVEIGKNPYNKVQCVLWELFQVVPVCNKLGADKVVFSRGFTTMFHRLNDTIIVHDLIPFYYAKNYPKVFNKVENFYVMWRLKASIQSASHVITISEASKKDILNVTSVKEEKISVINNGLNEISYNGKRQGGYLLAITSSLPHKNTKGVIESYISYCKKAEKPLPLIIVGEKDLDRFSIPDSIMSNITCYKYIESNDKLHELIANAEIFFFLSLIEGFGFPPIEAMQLGVPVVCSKLSSLPEVVGDAAILVDPNNYEEVADALIKVQEDKGLQKKMIEAGYDNVSRFEWDKIAVQYWRCLIDE